MIREIAVGAKYNQSPSSFLRSEAKVVPSFAAARGSHVDRRTVSSFGEEWNRFDSFSDAELEEAGRQYFDIIDDLVLNQDSLVMDVGCGSGRWSRYISDRASFIEAVDPSEAVLAAVRLTADKSNIRVTQAGVDNLPFDDVASDSPWHADSWRSLQRNRITDNTLRGHPLRNQPPGGTR